MLGPAALSPREARELRSPGKVGSKGSPGHCDFSHARTSNYDTSAASQATEKDSASDPYGSDAEAFSNACEAALVS